VRIVLGTTILVRATENSHGLVRELLLNIVASKHTLLLSTQILYELARILRCPRLQAFYGLSEERIYDFVGYLREVAEIVALSRLLSMPIRDVNDIVGTADSSYRRSQYPLHQRRGLLRSSGNGILKQSRHSGYGRHLPDASLAFLIC